MEQQLPCAKLCVGPSSINQPVAGLPRNAPSAAATRQEEHLQGPEGVTAQQSTAHSKDTEKFAYASHSQGDVTVVPALPNMSIVAGNMPIGYKPACQAPDVTYTSTAGTG